MKLPGMRSLTGRIVATVLLLELLCALALSGAALWLERNTRLRAFDVMLQGRSDSLLGAVQDAEDAADSVAVDPAEVKLPREDVYAVYTQGGPSLGGSPGAPPRLIRRDGDGVRNVRVAGRWYRVLEREGLRIIDRDENGGAGVRRPVTVVYAAPTAGLWHEVLESASFSLLVTAALVCSTTVLLIAVIRRLLHPIELLAAEASGLEMSTLRFAVPPSVTELKELRPLAEALSTAVGRLRESLVREQRFLSDAAHELKTAVAVVRSSIQVLGMRRREPEEYRGGLDRILEDNERVEGLVSRMLSTARFRERSPGGSEAVNVADSANEALRQLQSFAEVSAVTVQASLTTEMYARLSAEATHTLVTNLVVNAVQHSPRGSVVTVVLERAAAEERSGVLEVRDCGSGIAQDNLPHVFERFYREDTSRSRETGGAGLGLAICKGIAEAAGGRIEMDRVQGRGTTVRAFFSLV